MSLKQDIIEQRSKTSQLFAFNPRLSDLISANVL
jgi:hypothetical protein